MNRLTVGSAELVSRYCIWLWADGIMTGLVRTVGGVAAAGFIGGVCLATPVLLAPVAGIWLLAAWHADQPQDDAEDGDYTSAEFLELLHERMANDDRLHLAQIASYLYDDPNVTGQVRDLCAAAGVTITRGVRVPGRGVSTGLYRRDLPPLPAPSESVPVAVVVAGQHDQQHSVSNSQFAVIDDPEDPNRADVIWRSAQPQR